MYYVSRIDSAGRVFVTDTEDGVEEYVSRSQLDTLRSAGVEIEGIFLELTSSGALRMRARVKELTQNEKVALMLRTGLDADIDSTGELHHIRAIHTASREIVLSRICKSVGLNTLCDDLYNTSGHVFVFDDKLKSVSKRWRVGDKYMPCDVSRATKDSILIPVYTSMYKRINMIIDDDKRKFNYLQLICILSCIPYEKIDLGWRLFECGLDEEFILGKCKKTLLKDLESALKALSNLTKLPSNFDHLQQRELFTYTSLLNRDTTYVNSAIICVDDVFNMCSLRKGKSAFYYIMYGGQDSDIYNLVIRTCSRLAELRGFKFPA